MPRSEYVRGDVGAPLLDTTASSNTRSLYKPHPTPTPPDDRELDALIAAHARARYDAAQAAALHSDTAPEHIYRDRIADAVERVGWDTRAKALRLCGRAAAELTCKGCGSPHLTPFRCGARLCPTCAKIAAAAAVARLRPRVELHDAAMPGVEWQGARRRRPYHFQGTRRDWRERGWRMLTLTRRSLPGEMRWDARRLRAEVKPTRKVFARWWKSTDWGRQRYVRVPMHDAEGRPLLKADGSPRTRRTKRSRTDTSYVVGLEVSPGGMVHLHVVVYGEYLAQRHLLTQWRAALRDELGITDPRDGGVRVTAVRSREEAFAALEEVLKYATKGQEGRDGVESMPTPERAAAVEYAFHNVRRWDYGGALRLYTPSKETAEPDEREELHETRHLTCAGCGLTGAWEWSGIRGEEVVARNNGFGLYIGDIGEEYEPRPPDAMRPDQQDAARCFVRAALAAA